MKAYELHRRTARTVRATLAGLIVLASTTPVAARPFVDAPGGARILARWNSADVAKSDVVGVRDKRGS